MGRLSSGARCALASLGVVLALGCALSVVVDRVVRDQAAAEATRSAELVASFVSRGLAPAAFDRIALTPDEHASLDDVVADAADVRSLRLWGRSGRALYESDDSAAPAPVRPVDEALAAAYAGDVSARTLEVAGADVLRVHVPVLSQARRRPYGVVELDLDYGRTAARADRAVALLAGLLATGLSVLWALLWWLTRLVTVALRRAGEEQERLARTDGLTGLPNRAALLVAVDGARAGGTPCALVVVDVERFCEVNDTFGHAVGDDLLREVGARLRAHVREDEVVARLAADEFGVLLPGVADPVEALAVAGRLTAALHEPVVLAGLPLVVQVSTGVALAPQHAPTAEALLQRAEAARATAQELATGTALYDPDRDQGASDRLLLLADLERALREGELSLAYQPCFDLQVHGGCLAVEALVRWHSPTRGFVSPAEFVPVCERSSLVREFTEWVLGEALRQLRAWEDAGTVVNVAVNLSASNLAQDDLPELVRRLLGEHRIPADRLVLEITESAVIPDPQRAARVLRALVDLGVDMALDDFGTGWSSMSRLLELPLAALKVDRSFVADLPSGPGAAVVAATTRLAHDLGLFVVAEGVETEEQLQEVVRLGCDVGQGYLLSRPLPPAEVPAAVARSLAPPVRLPL